MSQVRVEDIGARLSSMRDLNAVAEEQALDTHPIADHLFVIPMSTDFFVIDIV